MRLSQFILDNLGTILQQWEDFARSLKPGNTMSTEALRDDAGRMLRFVAIDMDSEQTRQQSIDVASTPETGTRFTARLPRSSSNNRVKQPPVT